MNVTELTAAHHGWLIKVAEPADSVLPHRTFVLGKGFKVGVRQWTRPDGTEWVGLCDETDKRPGIVGTERMYPADTLCELMRPVSALAKRLARAEKKE
jgi:hypothetical protein